MSTVCSTEKRLCTSTSCGSPERSALRDVVFLEHDLGHFENVLVNNRTKRVKEMENNWSATCSTGTRVGVLLHFLCPAAARQREVSADHNETAVMHDTGLTADVALSGTPTERHPCALWKTWWITHRRREIKLQCISCACNLTPRRRGLTGSGHHDGPRLRQRTLSVHWHLLCG